jgi:predicted RNA binding protein YcfA (HicA-like mRNA interferase family)
MNGNEVIKKLQAAGWSLARINGSHHVMAKGNQSVSVHVHGKRDLKPGLIAGIARQTGVKLK